MRKTFVAISFVLAFAGSDLHAQFIQSYGIKLGGVGANQTWKEIYSSAWPTDNRWGFSAGAFVQSMNFGIVSVVGEVMYEQKGMRWSIPITTEEYPDGTGEYITESPRVDYLSVPVMARFDIPMPLFTPYFLAGPRVDILLNKRGNGLDVIVDQFAKIDYGVTLGVGVQTSALLPAGMLAEIRYNPNARDSYNNNFISVRNRSLDFLIGFEF